MSNNKLYTEEQVFKAIQMADKYHYLITSEECDIVNSLTPIKLPSDEEIEKLSRYKITENLRYNPLLNIVWIQGAKWMRDKIQGGNNEP